MPYIQVYAYSGRDMETKKKAAQAIMKAASEAMGAPESAFTIVYQDVQKENWEAEMKDTIEAGKDKLLIKSGEVVV